MKLVILFFTGFLFSTDLRAGETTSTNGIPNFQVNGAAIANGPLNSVSLQNLCNGDQSFSVYADRSSALQTCEMQLNPYFAQLIKAFIPKCAKEAAVKNGISLPTSVSVEQMGGYANRNARNSDRLSRHAHGMALDISAISLHTRDMLGRENTQRIQLTGNTTNQPFYDSFRSCWDSAVAEVSGRNCTCSIGHQHTHDPSNALHDNHMHISLSCPPSPGTVQCAIEKESPSLAMQN